MQTQLIQKKESTLREQVKQSEAPRKKSRKRKQVLNNVVSLRVSDKEKEVLEKITESSSKSVSDIVREAIEYWLARRQRLCKQS